jgi:hypothetical protein
MIDQRTNEQICEDASMTDEVKTPMTDAECQLFSLDGTTEKVHYIHADFARQLERELITLTLELEAARKDAERYRWLRDCDGILVSVSLYEIIDDGHAGGYALKQKDSLDAAIDAAKS